MPWHDDLTDNGIMMKESDVVIALSSGVNEKAELAGSTVSIQESNFCTSLDSAICELAPSFVDSNDVAFSSNLAELCSAAGYNTVVYGAPSDAVILKNGGVRFNSEYVAQRKAILNLFVNADIGDYTIPESISLSSVRCIVNSRPVIPYTITPADAYNGITWSSSSNHVSFDADGNITVISDGTDNLRATCSKNSAIYGVTSVYCRHVPSEDNVLACMTAIARGTYTQNGLTLTQNDDGTYTLDGTYTGSSSSYQRFALYPIGNNKNSFIHNLMWTTSDTRAYVWFEPISGTFDPDGSTFSVTNEKIPALYEIYVMNAPNSQSSMKVLCYKDGTSHTQYADTSISMQTTSCIVFGCQLKPGTVVDHFRFRVGFSYDYDSTYLGGLLQNYLAPRCKFVNRTVGSSTICRLLNGIFEFYFTSGDYWSFEKMRLTKTLYWDRSNTNMCTGDQIGEIGKTYTLTLSIIKMTIKVKSTSIMKLCAADASNNIIAQVDVITASTYESDQTGVVLDDTTYSSTFTLSALIDHVFFQYENIGQEDGRAKFSVNLQEVTN